MQNERRTKFLECRLTEEEVTEKGRSLARAEEERDQNAAKKKASMAQFKSVDDGLASVINTLTTEINNQREYRYVEIEERPDYEKHVMEIYRRDIGEKIDQRALTAEELQQKFAFADSKKAVEEFADKLDKGETVTISGGGKSATITGTGKKKIKPVLNPPV